MLSQVSSLLFTLSVWEADSVFSGSSSSQGWSVPFPVELTDELEASVNDFVHDQLVVDAHTGGISHIKAAPAPPLFWNLAADLLMPAPSPAPGHVETQSSHPTAASSSSAQSWRWTAPAPGPAPDAEPDAEPEVPDSDAPASKPPISHSVYRFFEPEGERFEAVKPRQWWEMPPEEQAKQAPWFDAFGKFQADVKGVAAYSRLSFDEEAAARADAYEGTHLWPSSRGRLTGEAGRSDHIGPRVVSPDTLAWKWTNPRGKYESMITGIAVDDHKNIYITSAEAIWKLSPDGIPIWECNLKPAGCVNCGFLWKGALYSATSGSPWSTMVPPGSLAASPYANKYWMALGAGIAFALDIETGKPIWRTKFCNGKGQTNGFTQVHNGVFVVGGDVNQDRLTGGGCDGEFAAFGLATKEGTVLWRFEADGILWNFGATFPDDDTLLIQDIESRAYRLNLKDGTLVWKAGGNEKQWTDATATFARWTDDGTTYELFFAVSAGIDHNTGKKFGALYARRWSDGELVWKYEGPYGCFNAIAVAPLRPGARHSVVMPHGSMCNAGDPNQISAFDAATGELQWTFWGPCLRDREDPGCNQAGDVPPYTTYRDENGIRACMLPNAWGSTAIGADGTIYVGNQDGQFYAIRVLDEDEDKFENFFRQAGHWTAKLPSQKYPGTGVLQVSCYDMEADFAGAASAAVLPGTLNIASIDTLYCFRE